MKRITRSRFIATTYLIVSIVLLSLLPSTGFITLIFSIPLVLLIISALYDGVRNKNYLFSCVLFFIFEIYAAVGLYLIFGDGSETSWRILYNAQELNEKTIRYIFVSLTILLLFYYWFNYTGNRSGRKTSSTVLEIKTLSIPLMNKLLFEGIYGIVIFYFIAHIGSLLYRGYSNDNNIMVLCLFRACVLIGMIITRFDRRNVIIWIESLLGFSILILFVRAGHRYMLVEWFVIVVFLSLSIIRRIRIRNIILLACVGASFYVLLIYIKSVLAEQDLMSMIFRHERNLFFSFNAIVQNINQERELTYLSTLKNVLPKAITGSSDLNTGGILMQYIAPGMQNETGINMGAFYLTEAYANFHRIGIYIISVILGFFCAAVEIKKSRKFKYSYGKNIYVVFYMVVVSQVYSIVCYGSSNYFKLVFYIMILALVTLFPIKKGKKQIISAA